MKIINTVLGLTTIIFACAVLSTTAQAQSLYRCGSAYQDRPCDDAKKGGKLVGGIIVSTDAASSPDATQKKSNETNQKAAESVSDTENSAREAANRKIRCDYMNTQLEKVLIQQRAGGNTRTMDEINQGKQDLERRMSADKC